MILVFVLALAMASCANQEQKPATGPVSNLALSERDGVPSQKAYDLERYLYTEHNYTDSAGYDVIIQNGYPKGGGFIGNSGTIGYTDSAGTQYGHVVFWNRVINRTDSTAQLHIDFPAEQFSHDPSSPRFIRLFIPPDTMTLDKLPVYSYGLDTLKQFLDVNFGRPASLHGLIAPDAERLFYVALLMHDPKGSLRAEFSLEDNDLFYHISGEFYGEMKIPCGRLDLSSPLNNRNSE